VGFLGAIVRVLLQCFRDLCRLIRAKVFELSITYAKSPRPRRLRTRSAFFYCQIAQAQSVVQTLTLTRYGSPLKLHPLAIHPTPGRWEAA
jgi:hypothetical protein